MEDHTTTDSTLAIVRELRKEFPSVGAVIQAYLYRSRKQIAGICVRGLACGCARC